MLRDCQNYRRDHEAEKPPDCCVWVGGAGELAERYCWICQEPFMSWLSTPMAKSKHYPWEDVRVALLQLNFNPIDMHRSLNSQQVHVRVWRGPIDLLVDDDTVPETEL
jgi:hypothetical protein